MEANENITMLLGTVSATLEIKSRLKNTCFQEANKIIFHLRATKNILYVYIYMYIHRYTHTYIYVTISFLYTRNKHNIVNQLYFNFKRPLRIPHSVSYISGSYEIKLWHQPS